MVSNIADLVREAGQRRPKHPAIVTEDRTTTWGEVDRMVHAVASGLVSRGLQPGDRVGLMMFNRLEFVTSYFGILRAGMTAVPLNTGYTTPELRQMVDQAGMRLLITEPDLVSVVASIESLDVLAVGTEQWRRFTVGSTPVPTDPTDPESLAVLLYTSGTSGRPKAAMLPHRCLLANLEQLALLHDPPAMVPEDVVLCVLPLFHIYALNATLGLTAKFAATIVLFERFEVERSLAAVAKHGVTNIAGAPPMYVAWSGHEELGQAMRGVRLAISGAAPLPPLLMEQFRTVTGQPIWEGYGMTECSPVISATLASGRAKPGFVGKPLPGVAVEVRGEDGELVEDGDPGEIFVRGDNVFVGYWPDRSDGPDADGWFATGDVAYVDEDGDLRLVDRRRELVIVSGFNVYPREVEDVLLTLPGVLEVAVMGVPHPYTGEAVKAFVVVQPDAGVTSEDVLEYSQTRLARFKCPTVVEIVADLPHSVTGKVSKGRLRETAGVTSL